MSELPGYEKDAPEGYYAVKDEYGDCEGCAFREDEDCWVIHCAAWQREDKQSVVFKKLQKHSTVAGRKLYVHSEDGHVVLAFEGEMSFLPRITILNYTDDPAKDIAGHVMALWNENANKIEKEGETMTQYPIVKIKNLRKYRVGDILRLKKTGELVKIEEYSACAYCVFYKQCCEGFMSYQKTGCVGVGVDFGGESVYFKPVEE